MAWETILALSLAFAGVIVLVLFWISNLDGGLSHVKYDWEGDRIGFWMNDIRIWINRNEPIIIHKGEMKKTITSHFSWSKKEKQHYDIIICDKNVAFTTDPRSLIAVLEKNNFEFKNEYVKNK